MQFISHNSIKCQVRRLKGISLTPKDIKDMSSWSNKAQQIIDMASYEQIGSSNIYKIVSDQTQYLIRYILPTIKRQHPHYYFLIKKTIPTSTHVADVWQDILIRHQAVLPIIIQSATLHLKKHSKHKIYFLLFWEKPLMQEEIDMLKEHRSFILNHVSHILSVALAEECDLDFLFNTRSIEKILNNITVINSKHQKIIEENGNNITSSNHQIAWSIESIQDLLTAKNQDDIVFQQQKINDVILASIATKMGQHVVEDMLQEQRSFKALQPDSIKNIEDLRKYLDLMRMNDHSSLGLHNFTEPSVNESEASNILQDNTVNIEDTTDLDHARLRIDLSESDQHLSTLGVENIAGDTIDFTDENSLEEFYLKSQVQKLVARKKANLFFTKNKKPIHNSAQNRAHTSNSPAIDSRLTAHNWNDFVIKLCDGNLNLIIMTLLRSSQLNIHQITKKSISGELLVRKNVPLDIIETYKAQIEHTITVTTGQKCRLSAVSPVLENDYLIPLPKIQPPIQSDDQEDTIPIPELYLEKLTPTNLDPMKPEEWLLLLDIFKISLAPSDLRKYDRSSRDNAVNLVALLHSVKPIERNNNVVILEVQHNYRNLDYIHFITTQVNFNKILSYAIKQETSFEFKLGDNITDMALEYYHLSDKKLEDVLIDPDTNEISKKFHEPHVFYSIDPWFNTYNFSEIVSNWRDISEVLGSHAFYKIPMLVLKFSSLKKLKQLDNGLDMQVSLFEEGNNYTARDIELLSKSGYIQTMLRKITGKDLRLYVTCMIKNDNIIKVPMLKQVECQRDWEQVRHHLMPFLTLELRYLAKHVSLELHNHKLNFVFYDNITLNHLELNNNFERLAAFVRQATGQDLDYSFTLMNKENVMSDLHTKVTSIFTLNPDVDNGILVKRELVEEKNMIHLFENDTGTLLITPEDIKHISDHRSYEAYNNILSMLKILGLTTTSNIEVKLIK